MAFNWKVLGVGATLVVPLVAILASSFGRNPQKVSNALEGRQTTPFVLETIDGQSFDSAALSGRPAVINFWATWCGPCRDEHPQLKRAAEAYAPQGVQFVGVLYRDETEKAQRYLAAAGAPYPNLVDPDQVVAIDYGVVGVPETFVLDSDGRVVQKLTGPVTAELLSVLLEPLL